MHNKLNLNPVFVTTITDYAIIPSPKLVQSYARAKSTIQVYRDGLVSIEIVVTKATSKSIPAKEKVLSNLSISCKLCDLYSTTIYNKFVAFTLSKNMGISFLSDFLRSIFETSIELADTYGKCKFLNFKSVNL